MGLSPFDPTDTTNYEIDYIPQRLGTLEVCVHACYLVISGRVTADGNAEQILQITSPFQPVPLCSPKQFVGIAIDAGLVANRTLLNFLGIKLDNGTLTEKSSALTVEKFGLALTPLSDATSILLPDTSADSLKNIWIEALTTASKSSAHFTAIGGKISVRRLGYACYATSLLVRQYFYKTQNKSEPPSYLPKYAVPQEMSIWNNITDGSDVMC
jgi:hypothetical protein